MLTEGVSVCSHIPSCSSRKTEVDRRDQYVLSSLLEGNKTIPPICDTGTFCPDDASTCLPLVPVGGHCQLNRDGISVLLAKLWVVTNQVTDECSPPGVGVKFSVPNEWDQATGDGAICLEGICM